MLRRYLVICLVFICVSFSNDIFAQSKRYTIYDTIPIRSGTKKKRLYKLINKWFESERGTKLIAKNKKNLEFRGKGYFIYYNRVKIPDIFLSPHANERCKGSIIFTIDIKIQDSIIVTKYSNFVHEAYYSEYGSMTFGMLMDYEKVPPGTCMEVEEWCNAVWGDMKNKSLLEVKDRTSRMIPAILIRRRSFKVKEDVVEVVKEEKIDPKEYLKLDNYLIKEDKSEIREEERKAKEEEVVEKVEEKSEESKAVETPTETEAVKPTTKEDSDEEESETKKQKGKKHEESEEKSEEPKAEKPKPAKESKPKETKKAKTEEEELEDEYDDE